jgi:hypothetical protein
MRKLTQLLFALATLTAATTADAKPRKVVVVDFDGLPRNLADSGRSNVMSLLGSEYELVPSKKWDLARGEVGDHGPQAWQAAAKKSGVDAVVEGWVNTEGRHHTLTVQIRDASTGVQIDSVSVKIGDKGLSDDVMKQLAGQLDEVLNWVDGDATSSDIHRDLPDARDRKPTIGRKKFAHKGDDSDDEDLERSDRGGRPSRFEHDDDRDHRGSRRHDDDRDDDRRGSRYRDDRDDDRRGSRRRDDDRDDDRRSNRDRDDRDDRSDRRGDSTPGLKRVADSSPTVPAETANPVLEVFPADAKEIDIVSTAKPPRVVTPAPKFALYGGAFILSRGMSFAHDPPDSTMALPDYPAQGLAGLSLGGSVYPMPINKLDVEPSGLGFSFALQKSVGSLFSAYDPDGNTYGDYTIDHTAYEGGIHYRYPTDLIVADADLNYGKYGYIIQGLPGGVQIPDVDYSYISFGGTLDLKITDRTRGGFGAHYMYLLDAGDVSDEGWYGSGSASGLDLEAHFQIPVSQALYVRGQVDYRRVSMDFEESGDVSSMLEVANIVDSTIGAQFVLGVQF